MFMFTRFVDAVAFKNPTSPDTTPSVAQTKYKFDLLKLLSDG